MAIPSRSDLPEVQKRILVVDANRNYWEVPARLLIAKGYLIHRISHLSEAPPRWPAHLYDLVLIATADPASADIAQFCATLRRIQPVVRIALLAFGQATSPAEIPLIPLDKPSSELADSIARLLSES